MSAIGHQNWWGSPVGNEGHLACLTFFVPQQQRWDPAPTPRGTERAVRSARYQMAHTPKQSKAAHSLKQECPSGPR